MLSRSNNEIGRKRERGRGNLKIEEGLIPWKFVISDTNVYRATYEPSLVCTSVTLSCLVMQLATDL